jgi:hypothetical protein
MNLIIFHLSSISKGSINDITFIKYATRLKRIFIFFYNRDYKSGEEEKQTGVFIDNFIISKEKKSQVKEQNKMN